MINSSASQIHPYKIPLRLGSLSRCRPFPVRLPSHSLQNCSVSCISSEKMEVDPSEMRYLEDDDSPTLKVIKGTTSGFVAGTIWGTVVATWHDVPRVERSVALPGLVRTLKMMGSHGVTFAAIGGVYIGIEQLVQHYRMKRDYINGAVGGFAAGASVLGFKARSIKGALAAGSALAVTSALIDVGGQTTRIDNGKEYYPYTTKNRSAVTE